jgi:hypothetical protein
MMDSDTLSLEFAIQLKTAGLAWKPALHDFFAVPGRGLDNQLFVIADMLANQEKILGASVVAFQGASEWALDYLLTTEAVWVPSEAQLRRLILERLPEGQSLNLTVSRDMSACAIHVEDEDLIFEAASAPEAYGQALLHILRRSPEEPGPAVDRDGSSAPGASDPWEKGFSEIEFPDEEDPGDASLGA